MSASKWKPYPSYKESIERESMQIPSHWEMIANRHLMKLRNKKVGEDWSSTDLLSLTVQGIRLRDIDSGVGKYPASFEAYQIVEKDDLVFCFFDIPETPRTIGISKQRGMITGAYDVLTCVNGISPNFIHDYYLAIDLIKGLEPYYTGLRKVVRTDAFNQMKTPIPPFNEQLRITKFIQNIDFLTTSLQSILEEKIDLLEEKRSALITQAVTKGLNPNVQMVDSEIDWIGEIPEHWVTKKVKHLFQLTNVPSITGHEMQLLSVYTSIGVRPRKSLKQKGNKATSTDGYWLVQKEDLVVNKLLAWMGAIGRSEYDGVTSPAYDILRPLSNTVTEYYHFLFRCGICLPEFKKRSRGIMEMRLRLYFEELGSIEVPCPPPEEQQKIADYIRNLDDTQIDLENALKKQIEKLKEYRTSLISAAVTGKIDIQSP